MVVGGQAPAAPVEIMPRAALLYLVTQHNTPALKKSFRVSTTLSLLLQLCDDDINTHSWEHGTRTPVLPVCRFIKEDVIRRLVANVLP